MNTSSLPPPFEKFPSIERLAGNVTITEKIHGSNAQIAIWDEGVVPEDGSDIVTTTRIKAGSRTRWLEPGKLTDNYGFAAWVEANAEALIAALGPGRHYGEWYGSGINSGYGLVAGDRRFALFNTHSWTAPYLAGALPKGVEVVPVLYSGPWRDGVVSDIMAQLLASGSKMAPGFMKPEGIVIRFERNGMMLKHVFEAEESGWCGKPRDKAKRQDTAVDDAAVRSLFQPIRLEKVLSKDSALAAQYPVSLPQITKAYVEDMEKEAQFDGVDPLVVKTAKRELFGWIKTMFLEKGYRA